MTGIANHPKWIRLIVVGQVAAFSFSQGFWEEQPPSDISGTSSQQLFQTSELIEWLRCHPPKRKLLQWHIHHTWDPSYADFNWGNHVELHEEMRKLHVVGNGWDDIGQHFTLFPDGLWMLGRDLEQDPASILGWNTGAVAVEMVGNFDFDADNMTALQQDAMILMSRFMLNEWHLELRFHRDHPQSGKTCPGSSIDRSFLMREIESSNSHEVGAFSERN